MNYVEFEHAKGVVAQLQKVKDANGGISPWEMAWACRQTGRSQSTIYGWLRDGVPQKQVPTCELTEELKQLLYITPTKLAAFDEACARGLWQKSQTSWYRACDRELKAEELAYIRRGAPGFEEKCQRLPYVVPDRAASRATDIHQIDVWVSTPGGGVAKPYIIGVKDQYSGCIAAAVFTLHEPRAYDVQLAIGEALRPGLSYTPVWGIPNFFRHDNGGAFTADSVVDMLFYFGITPSTSEAYKPRGNGKIENWWNVFEKQCCSKLPGYVGGPENLDGTPDIPKGTILLSFDEFTARAYDGIAKYNFERNPRTPEVPSRSEVWEADSTELEEPDDAALRFFTFVPVGRDGGRRKVSSRGVRVHNAYFHHENLDLYVDKHVQVLWRPGDYDTRAVFEMDTWKYICEAVLVTSLNEDERGGFYGRRSAKFKEYEGRRIAANEVLLGDWEEDRQRYTPVVGPGDRAEPMDEAPELAVPVSSLVPRIGNVGDIVESPKKRARKQPHPTSNHSSNGKRPAKAGSVK